MAPHQLLDSQTLLQTPLPSNITLPARPDTDIWSTPPTKKLFTAPFLCTIIPIANFRSVRATISAAFDTNTQQGGLLIAFPPCYADLSEDVLATPAEAARRWVTATLEFEHDRLNISVVSCERWADWSLHPLPPESVRSAHEAKVSLVMERKVEPNGKRGPRLKVSMVGRETRIIREVAWAFEDGVGELWVGVLANQATAAAGDGIEGARVTFEDVEVETL